jgi:DHA2 family multidrug resistance protein
MSTATLGAGDGRRRDDGASDGARAAPSAAVPAPLTGGTLVVATLALSLATFMNVLDTSIANVSIPAIAGDLGVSPSQGTWVITSFAVANAISLPLTGWLSQRYGQVRLFVASVLLFVLASFLCGLAPSLELLIAFRVLQGAVAGPMIPLSQSILLSSYPKAKAGSALAIWAITTLVAPVVGPLLGGWITDNVAWPWIFYINVPVGLAAAAITWSVYRKRDTPRSPAMACIDTLAIDVSSTFMNVASDSASVATTSVPPVSGAGPSAAGVVTASCRSPHEARAAARRPFHARPGAWPRPARPGAARRSRWRR